MRFAPLLRAGALALAATLASPAPAAPDMTKVIREVFPVAETGFDPAAVHDLYSGTVVQGIFETLYTYDYLARPAKVVPLTADGMPQVADGGKTWTVKLKKGIRFADDPAFGGKPRELVAEDVVYSLKRLIDPRMRSPWAFLVEGKFVGLDDLAAKAKEAGKFDYDQFASIGLAPYQHWLALLDDHVIAEHRRQLNRGRSGTIGQDRENQRCNSATGLIHETVLRTVRMPCPRRTVTLRSGMASLVTNWSKIMSINE